MQPRSQADQSLSNYNSHSMGWTCLVERLQQPWEFGKENCTGPEVFYKEAAQGRGEGGCEEILSEDEIQNSSGEKQGPFPVKTGVCSERLWCPGWKGENQVQEMEADTRKDLNVLPTTG